MRHTRTIARLAVTALTATALLSGCSASDFDVFDAFDKPGTLDDMQPTGPPSELTPADGDGESVSLGDGLSVVMPEGSEAEPVEGQSEGDTIVRHVLPGADDNGLPSLTLMFGPSDSGAIESSYSHEQMISGSSDGTYERSLVEWPGAEAAVVSTWTEQIAMDDGGTLALDAQRIWIETPDGIIGSAMAVAPSGELAGSTAVDALRTVAVERSILSMISGLWISVALLIGAALMIPLGRRRAPSRYAPINGVVVDPAGTAADGRVAFDYPAPDGSTLRGAAPAPGPAPLAAGDPIVVHVDPANPSDVVVGDRPAVARHFGTVSWVGFVAAVVGLCTLVVVLLT